MKKIIRKEFVLCKDTVYQGIQLNKGDIVELYPVEFFDDTEPEYRVTLLDGGLDPSTTLDMMIFSSKEFNKMLVGEEFNIKYSKPIETYNLPYIFNMLKIAPRNVTVKVNDEET